MKKVAKIIIYWTIVVLLTATMLVSLDMAFSRALFISSLLLPGAIITRFVLPSLLGSANGQSRKNLVFFILGILTLEILLIMVGYQVIITADNMLYSDVFQKPVIPGVLFNPIFISAIVILTCGGDYLLSKDFTKTPSENKKSGTLTFTSDRNLSPWPLRISVLWKVMTQKSMCMPSTERPTVIRDPSHNGRTFWARTSCVPTVPSWSTNRRLPTYKRVTSS